MRFFNIKKIFNRINILNSIIFIKTWLHIVIKATIAVIRPGLGGLGICIYTDKTCQNYVADVFAKKSFFYALIKALIRILSCNPIIGVIRYFRLKKVLHK